MQYSFLLINVTNDGNMEDEVSEFVSAYTLQYNTIIFLHRGWSEKEVELPAAISLWTSFEVYILVTYVTMEDGK